MLVWVCFCAEGAWGQTREGRGSHPALSTPCEARPLLPFVKSCASVTSARRTSRQVLNSAEGKVGSLFFFFFLLCGCCFPTAGALCTPEVGIDPPLSLLAASPVDTGESLRRPLGLQVMLLQRERAACGSGAGPREQEVAVTGTT